MNDYALLDIRVHVMGDGTEVYTEVSTWDESEIEIQEEL